jgi:flagellar biosynthesis chaperone FliJ
VSEKVAKAQRRNLKNAIGEQAAAAVVDVRELAHKTRLEHVVLAQQMLEFERTVAQLKEARAHDLKTVAGLREQLESAHARLSTRGQTIDALCNDTTHVHRRLDRLERTWWQRLRAWFGDGV